MQRLAIEKKKILSQNNCYRDFSEGWQGFSFLYNRDSD